MSGDLVWAVVRLFVALPLILGLAYLILKYGLSRRYPVAGGKPRMKLVEQLPLGPKTTLSLVAFNGKHYLFAHQDNTIKLVKELDELADAEEIIEQGMEQFTPRTAREFDKLLRSMASGAPGKLHKMKKTIWASLTAEGTLGRGKVGLKIALLMILLTLIIGAILMFGREAAAQPFPAIDLNVHPADSPAQVVDSVKLLVLLTLLTLAPAILVMLTSFTRIIIVLSLLRNALGVQAVPANQIIIGLALFLTVFIMAPTGKEINEQAIQPYLNNQIGQEEAQELGAQPLREFMLRQTREKDLELFINLAKIERPGTPDDVPLHIVVPSFVVSELKTAFEIGFLLFVPFLVIDMVVASILMSMGMFMLPPIMISLPFKLLLFVMVDGWYLVVKSLVESFR